MQTTDFLIIGGGIIGLTIARGLKRRYADAQVTVLEKESTWGAHASGRNSGVLHAGFYYTPESLKAKFTRDGNRWLTRYCRDKGLPIRQCGKLVVARDEQDYAAMDVLLARGRDNGIDLQEVTEREANAIEPRVKTCGRALFSPTTATVDPLAVVSALASDAQREGVRLHTGTTYCGREGTRVRTSIEDYEAGYVVNAAGLYADRVARDFGFSKAYAMLPFKGLYLYADDPAGSFRTNIYPVPDLNYPFLGVHVTVDVHGRAKIGPTAIPAFWREHYGGTANFRMSECVDMVCRQLRVLGTAGFDYTRLAVRELRKYSRAHLVALASSLATGIDIDRFRDWGRPGIRAQLLDRRTNRLEMDFVVEGDSRSLHVLNAVSPGFTCAWPFSAYVCDQVERLLAGAGANIEQERDGKGARAAP